MLGRPRVIYFRSIFSHRKQNPTKNWEAGTWGYTNKCCCFRKSDGMGGRSSKIIAELKSSIQFKIWLSAYRSHLFLWRAEAEVLPKKMRPSLKILVIAVLPLSFCIVIFPYLNLLFLGFLFPTLVIYLQSFHVIQYVFILFPLRWQEHQWDRIGYTRKYIPSHYLLSHCLSKLFIFTTFYINLSFLSSLAFYLFVVVVVFVFLR